MAKRILVIAVMIFAALEASAGDFVDEMCKSYKKVEGAQVISLGKTMLSMAFAKADKETKATLKKINKMTIVALDADKPGLGDRVKADLSTAEQKGAQLIGEMTDDKTKTYFKAYIVKEGELYTHLLMYFKSDDGTKSGLIDMSGRFLESDLETLGKSAKPI
ncbi:MAG: DUF4252 domain-containing protein [Bacteroidales bacterium]|nr:DUF4252 domain-containing protein [Bacteroidales bacterium]